MNATCNQSPHRTEISQAPSRHEIRQAAERIRRSWSPIEREFRREVGAVQRRRLAATLIRSAA